MSKEVKIIPELRFPEFSNEGNWEKKLFGKFIEERNEISNGENPLFSLTIENGVTIKTERYEREFLVKNKKDAYKLVYPNDFAYNPMNLRFGAIARHNGKLIVALSKYYNIFYCDDSVDSRFCEFYFKSHQLLTKYDDIATGSLIEKRRVHFSNFLKLKIPFPKDEVEQQKIASCLSSLDELIAAHNDKLQALKDHKKGLMQNLFPQEGQTVPNYRFPEFQNDAEWVEKELGNNEVAGFVNSKVDSERLTLYNYISTDNMLPDYSGITKASKLPTISRVTEFMEGDILISNIRPYLKKVWKSDRTGGASNDVLVFRSGSLVVSEFLEFVIKNDAFINYVMKGAKGVKMPRGDKDSMLEYPVRIPDPKEQQKIASCLSALDELITAQTDKIEQLQQHKKGLMQGLFPKI